MTPTTQVDWHFMSLAVNYVGLYDVAKITIPQ